MTWTKSSFILALILLILVGTNLFVASQVMKVSGLAVAQSSTHWNHVCDGVAVGDGLTDCTLAAQLFGFNGVGADRLLSTQANGLEVDVTRQPATEGADTPSDAFANPSNAVTTWSLQGLFDGTNWERVRSYSDAIANQDGNQFPATGVMVHNPFGGGSGTLESWKTRPNNTPVVSLNHFRGQLGNGEFAEGAADTAVSVSVTGVGSQRALIYLVNAFCSAGTATLTIDEDAVDVWKTPVDGVGTTLFSQPFLPSLTAAGAGATLTATLSSCGAGNTGTIFATTGID